jgi:hypothetical protein
MSDCLVMRNVILKEAFRYLHDKVVDQINPASIIDKLFAVKVIGANDVEDLNSVANHRSQQCRRLMIILHNSSHPEAFVELRRAIASEEANRWLVMDIDRRYGDILELPVSARERSESTTEQEATGVELVTCRLGNATRCVESRSK